MIANARMLGGAALLVLAGCGEVVGPGGTAADAAPQPTISSVSPDHGPLGGGIEITVSGSGLSADGGAHVVVGGFLATDVTIVDDATLVFVLPAGASGGSTVDVVVANQNGLASQEDALTYGLPAFVLDVSPRYVRQLGGTTFTITGRRFEEQDAGETTVLIAGVEATSVDVVDDDTLMVTSPELPDAEPFAPLDVVVRNANGDATAGVVRATAQGLMATERRCCNTQNRVLYIDPANGNTQEIGRLSSAVAACALAPNGTLFGVRNASGGKELVTFDPLTGEVAAVGRLRDGANTAKSISALAFVGNNLYGWSRSDGRLASINTATGVITVLGAASLGQSHQNGIVQRDATSVYFADQITETLDSVNTTTGALTAGATFNQPCCSTFRGMTSHEGVVYLSEYFGQRRVLQVNPTTAATTEVARLPFQTSGLCSTPPSF